MYSEIAHSITELQHPAEKLLKMFPNQRVFAIYGKMGAGKTTFIQSICHQLGSEDNVISPTFAIINEYRARNGESIYHFDFYRINNLNEAFDMGYEDYFYSGNYCFIEWPEKILSLLPANVVNVKIEVDDKESRIITANVR
jgi:tRNA threonylcarbamoyladenosine biosynthesis protein TsaE